MVIEEKELKRTHKYISTNAKNNVSYALLSKLQNTFAINNRRYLGNKYKLNEFIKETIIRECGEFATFADLFAGTGAVAAMFQNKHLIVNDILYSNFVCYQTWFGNENYSLKKISNYINKYNSTYISKEENYMSQNFSNTFFSQENCKKIGYIREDIEQAYQNAYINHREKCILITSLLYAMDKIANTCGHYDAYRKNGDLDKRLVLLIPEIEQHNLNNEIYNEDINELVKSVYADVIYLDPPYNSRQYCDSYHLLENVACWNKPQVSGIAKKMDRTNLKSEFCTTSATSAFENLIKNIKAKYIVLSYNNMANKGNERSNAKLHDDDILRILKAKGTIKIFSQKYKAFSTGKSNIKENAERLFICKCF